jgi:serine/threonine protein kinase
MNEYTENSGVCNALKITELSPRRRQVLRAEYRGAPVAVKRLAPADGGSGALHPWSWSGSLGLKGWPGGGSGGHVGGSESPAARRGSGSDEPETPGTDSDGPRAGPTIEALLGPAGAGGVRARSSRRREEFLEEIRLLSRLRHPNVLGMIGAVYDAGAELLVTEVLEHGSLRDLLRNRSDECLMLHCCDASLQIFTLCMLAMTQGGYGRC